MKSLTPVWPVCNKSSHFSFTETRLINLELHSHLEHNGETFVTCAAGLGTVFILNNNISKK